MYKLEFTLKQHTPIIHFQHDQDGATLRASEVKPKLDFFIMKKLINDDTVPDEKIREKFQKTALRKQTDGTDHPWKNWLVGKGEHPALDYKLSFMGELSDKYIIASRLDSKFFSLIGKSFKCIPESAFFAEEKSIGALFEKPRSEGDKPTLKVEYTSLLVKIRKQGIINKDESKEGNDIDGKVVSFDHKLIQELKTNIVNFFLSENFGCRQNKGFGCFTVNEIEGKRQIYDIPKALKEIFDYVYLKNISNDFAQALLIIQKDYKLMKAGRGRQEGYAKSKLFLYFARKDVRWEKRWIKQEFSLTDPKDFPDNLKVSSGKPKTEPIDVNLKNDWDDNNNPRNSIIEYKYIRALLGLAEHFEFQTTSLSKEKFIVQIGSESNPIQRFKSPITFKFLDGNIYLLANKMVKGDNSPLGAGIEFTFRIKDRQGKLLKTPNLIIPNPPLVPSSFNIEDFIDFAIKDYSDNAKIDGFIKV